MEIPNDLKKLYAHWQKHVEYEVKEPSHSLNLDQEILGEIAQFIKERMLIWKRKSSGVTPPYSSDPILQNFRFCNIYRELDRQTIEIHQDIFHLKPNFDLWLLNLCFHRFVCRPETVKSVGHLSFDQKENRKVMQNLLNHHGPKYGTAYIFPISVIQTSNYPTREKFLCEYLPTILPKISQIVQSFSETSVNQALEMLIPRFKFNLRFHWTEILIDVAYQFPERINLFTDFHIGPGAKPTLLRLTESKDLNKTLNDLVNFLPQNFPYLTFNQKPVLLSAENWEGIACEFRKYSNISKGEGRKRKFTSNLPNSLIPSPPL